MTTVQNLEISENLILKKRLNTCRTSKGSLVKIPNDLVINIVKAWERWPGNAKSFYQSIGIKKEQLANIIKKGKRLFKDNNNDSLGPFIPVTIEGSNSDCKIPIILRWDKKRSIRFYQVDHLIDFLNKAA